MDPLTHVEVIDPAKKTNGTKESKGKSNNKDVKATGSKIDDIKKKSKPPAKKGRR